FVVYLLVQLRNQPHPLDVLPDPSNKGAPRKAERTRHDYPLAAHQKVGLGSAVRVGEVEVEAQTVERTREGNLMLAVRVKNLSDAQTFSPISDQFLHVQKDSVGGKPYTFLESVHYSPVYGAFLEFRKGPRGTEEQVVDGELAPGQEELIVLTTMDSDRKL